MRFVVLTGMVVLVAGAMLLAVNAPVATPVAHASPVAAAPAEPSPEAVERTRKTVRMLDDIYKTAVVLITEHYVHEETDLSAGSAAAALFSAIEEKGWHSARLVDATGQPYDEKNVAKDEFEKEAIEKIREGETYYEQITERDGKPVLRAFTAIPVVMDKCVMCHPHYAHAEEGAAIGAIAYIIPIEE